MLNTIKDMTNDFKKNIDLVILILMGVSITNMNFKNISILDILKVSLMIIIVILAIINFFKDMKKKQV